MKRASSLSKAQLARIAANVGIPTATAAAHINRTKAPVLGHEIVAKLIDALREISKFESPEGDIAMRALNAAGVA
jgi:hypothetical protein